MYKVLGCVVYSLIDNYVYIDYLLFRSKTLSSFLSNTTFEQTSFNILLGIGVPELLLNLVSCHGFMKKPNSTVILNFQYHLVKTYLEKVFYVIESDSKQKFMLPNNLELRANVIDKLDTDFSWQKKRNFLCSKHHQKFAYSEKYAFDLQTRLI